MVCVRRDGVPFGGYRSPPTFLPMDTGTGSAVESINFTTLSPSGRFASMVARPFTLRFPQGRRLRTGPAIGFDSRKLNLVGSRPCGLGSLLALLLFISL